MGERPRPLYSAHAEDPALIDAIDLFVIALAETVDELQDAHRAADCQRLGQLARELAVDAAYLGYAPLARLAQEEAEEKCLGAVPAEHQDALRELHDLSETVEYHFLLPL